MGAGQGGRMQLITVAQARSLGMSEWTIAHGTMRAPHRGLRTDSPAPPDVAGRCRELLPLLPPGSTFCRATALDLFGIEHPRGLRRPRDLHVQVPRSVARPRRVGVVPHTRLGPPASVRTVRGCPVMSPENTWIDLAGELDPIELTVLGDSLLRRRQPVSTLARLRAAVDRVAPGTRGVRRLREALDAVRPGTDSCQETRLRLLLTAMGLPVPDVNRPILVGDRFLAMPDLSYPGLRIAIEYDGEVHRTDRRTWSRDIRRRRALEAHGWVMVTWTAADLRDPTSALRHLRAQIARRGVSC